MEEGGHFSSCRQGLDVAKLGECLNHCCPSSAGSRGRHMHVAHGAMWQRNDTRAQLPALPWEPFGPGNPQDTQGPAAQLQASMAEAVMSHRIPKNEVAAVLPCKCTRSWLPAEEQGEEEV